MQAQSPAITPESDSDLLNRIARGDRAALEVLYVRYHRRLARFVRRFSSRHDAADEIINDTFMVVWQRARDFRGASRVSTWIIGIAYRTALKSLRRNDAQLRVYSRGETPELSVDPMKATEMHDWIAQALEFLPPEQRLTMELAYNLGHSVEEIATITDCPVGTVKGRMFHARENLRRHLPALGGLSNRELDQSRSL